MKLRGQRGLNEFSVSRLAGYRAVPHHDLTPDHRHDRPALHVPSVVGGIGIDVLFRKSIWKGNNSRNGLFLISGEGIKKGKNIDIEIYDLAPTILHIFDAPIPVDIDGKVLKEIFREGSEISKNKIHYEEYDKEGEKLRNKIRNLKLNGKI